MLNVQRNIFDVELNKNGSILEKSNVSLTSE